MNFSNLSKSQLSRDEMRIVSGGNEIGSGDCYAYCDKGSICPSGCECKTLHGADRCYLK